MCTLYTRLSDIDSASFSEAPPQKLFDLTAAQDMFMMLYELHLNYFYFNNFVDHRRTISYASLLHT